MSLNNTPAANRIHIGIFGRRNAGKSSVINAITGQSLAIVSDIKGTTTDPVSKAMELLPLGPVVIIDTPGLDDIGELGAQRIQKAYQVLNKTDIAILVVDASVGFTREDEEILKRIYDKKIPYVTVLNKIDRCEILPEIQDVSNTICVSAITGYHIQELKEMIAAQTPDNVSDSCLVRDLIAPSDFVILVVPIDKAAPKAASSFRSSKQSETFLTVTVFPLLYLRKNCQVQLHHLAKNLRLSLLTARYLKKLPS